jgi:hypothetical protein
MNELQKVKDYIVNKFDSDVLVNTLTTLSNDLVDTNKETIYPLVNIDYKNVTVQDDVILFTYHIKALDQNDVYIKTTDSKLQQDTNQSDIWNETFNICQSFINSFRQYNSDNVEMSGVSDISVIKNKNLNDLSGHEFDIVLSINNAGSACPS